MLSKEQIKLMNELRVRYLCVRADIASCPSEIDQLSNVEYGHLISTRINQERECFSRKHNISIDEILKMEDAYNKLEDVEEYHQFLDYNKICDIKFYMKLENIVKQQVYADSGLGKHFIPEPFLKGYEIQKREVEKRVRRCRKALERIVPKMTVFEYEDIKYISQYEVDHNQLEEKDIERDLIIRLCKHALEKDYLNSKLKQFLYHWFLGREYM